MASPYARRRWAGDHGRVGDHLVLVGGLKLLLLFPSKEGFWVGVGVGGIGISGMAGFSAPESVITSLAGFGSHRPSHWADAPQSRRFQVRACGFPSDMGRLLDAPQRTSPAVPELRLVVSSSSFKTLAMPRSLQASAGFNVPGRYSRWPVFR